MRIILATLCILMFSLPAQATPGESMDQQRLEILGIPQSECSVSGGFCLTSGADTTLADPSGPGPSSHAAVVPSFSRVSGTPTADRHGSGYTDDAVPWTLDVNASLRRRALAGNAIFLVYDAENRKAVLAHEVTAAWQDRIPAGDRVAARLVLSVEDGFHANHTYLIRIVQLVHGKELLLAEGQVRLN